MASFTDRLQHAWNAFTERDPTPSYSYMTNVSTLRPDRSRLIRGGERSIVNSVITRIALDVAAVSFKHARVDDNGRYLGALDTELNKCLTFEANRDQTGRAFIQDVVMSMLDEGCVAIVPTDTTISPKKSEAYQINSMRTGKILEWAPAHVKVRVYNENTGLKEELVLPKSMVAIIENPLYSVMNEPNSTLQRLIRKLALLDNVDEQSSAGKLDIIVSLPYAIKTEARKRQAEARRKEIEAQLAGSKYGIAYTDGTEKITQLNRSLENNLMKQIEYLTSTLYSQLGLTTKVFDGTADDKEMLNYYDRTIEPILAAIATEMERKFLTKTARTQKQRIYYYRDPFKLVPANEIAEIADKFTRNEIMSSNEIRQLIGLTPVNSPQADELRNKNLNAGNGQEYATTDGPGDYGEYYEEE